jgi:hypothetical protein
VKKITGFYDGKVGSDVEFRMEYDKQNNWTRREVINSGITVRIFTRQIEYY